MRGKRKNLILSKNKKKGKKNIAFPEFESIELCYFHGNYNTDPCFKLYF